LLIYTVKTHCKFVGTIHPFLEYQKNTSPPEYGIPASVNHLFFFPSVNLDAHPPVSPRFSLHKRFPCGGIRKLEAASAFSRRINPTRPKNPFLVDRVSVFVPNLSSEESPCCWPRSCHLPLIVGITRVFLVCYVGLPVPFLTITIPRDCFSWIFFSQLQLVNLFLLNGPKVPPTSLKPSLCHLLPKVCFSVSTE